RLQPAATGEADGVQTPGGRPGAWCLGPAAVARGERCLPRPVAVHGFPARRRAGWCASAGGDGRGHCDRWPAHGGPAMNPVPMLPAYLTVGAILFVLGMVGFLARRNLIIMFLCVEMMLQGVALNLVAFARYRGNLQGQAFTLFILTVAACEAAIALALI